MTFFAASRLIKGEDAEYHLSVPVRIFYPTLEPASPQPFGPFTLDVCADGAPAEGRFPLAVISHGSGGAPLLYRGLALYLAQHGYITALPEHAGNNREDNHWSHHMENYICRPRHISLTIDSVLADTSLQAHVQTEQVAAIGHSMGAYAALAAAGGIPWTKEGQRVPVTPDDRIKVLVLMAPATGWFDTETSLERVNIPILLYAAEMDKITPPEYVGIIQRRIKDPGLINYRLVKNGGHFSFLTPFPAEMRRPQFMPSSDPPGFDREAFHEILNREVLQFLDEKLKDQRG